MPVVPDERSLTRPPAVVVIGASAGGIQALSTILQGLPSDFPAPIVVVQHRTPRSGSLLVPILKRRTRLPVVDAVKDEGLKPGVVYIARPDLHLTFTDTGCLAYHNGRRIHHLLSSATPLFMSAADVYGPGAIGVILTGSGQDGTDGVQSIRRRGGVVIAQNEATSEHFAMPRAAIATGAVDYVLPLEAIGPALMRLARARSRPSEAPDVEAV